MTAPVPARASSSKEQHIAHHEARGGIAFDGAANDQRVRVQVLLLRVDVHGAAVAFEPENLRLLDELHREDRDGFLQVCSDLEEYGVAPKHVIAAISFMGAEIDVEGTARGSTLPPEIASEVAASRSYAHRPDEIYRGTAP
jgi:hypothetical protein